MVFPAFWEAGSLKPGDIIYPGARSRAYLPVPVREVRQAGRGLYGPPGEVAAGVPRLVKEG